MRSHASYDEARISYIYFLYFFSICVSHVCAVFPVLESSLTWILLSVKLERFT